MTSWLNEPIKAISDAHLTQALNRQAVLTKPAGSLGRLEDIAVRLAGMQATATPVVEKIHITVFAGDHGVAEENVSLFPQAVTTEMIRNFARGGAAISVLAKQLGATLEVLDMGTVVELETLPGVVSIRIAKGTQNFSQQTAMTQAQCDQALQAGRDVVERAIENNAHIFIAGEMGIANTTSASAIACALLDKTAQQLAGPGTGLDASGVQHKVEVIDRALLLHKSSLSDAREVLCCLGGFEIVAICGAYIRAAQKGIPVIVDGFISSVAALAATRLCGGASNWFIYAHRSAEPGHKLVLEGLNAQPLLDIGMRLGEGSGAAAAIGLLQSAVALHNQMATFEEASVSNTDG